MKLLSAILCCALGISVLRAEDRVRGSNSYMEWASAHGLAGVFAQPDADLDGDGITNIMAYAFGLEPAGDPDAWAILPSLIYVGQPPEPVLEFVIPANPRHDVSYIVDCITANGKRVEIARKSGGSPWRGSALIIKALQDDGSTDVTVIPPPEIEISESGKPLRLRVDFSL
jgi:hypothetical protein